MTVDTAVNVEGEKSGMDVKSSCEDRPLASVGSGSECNGDGKDDYVFVNGSDAASDDHVDVQGNGELNVSESNREFEGKFDEVGVHVNGGDQLEACNGYNGILDNVVKFNGGESKIDNGVVVEEESVGKVEGEELVKNSGEIKLDGEDIVNDGELVGESGDAHIVDDRVDVEVKGSEVVKESDLEDKVNDGELDVEKEDVTNVSVDGIGNPSLDDDDKERNLPAVDSTSDMVQNVILPMGADSQIPHTESEEQLHLERSEEDENEAKEAQKLDDRVKNAELVEDNSNSHVDDVQVANSEPVDVISKESNPLEVECIQEFHEDGIVENQQPDNEGEELALDNAVTEKQIQQQDPQSGDSKPGLVEAEAETLEQGDLGAPELSESQDPNYVESEAAASELQQNRDSEIKDQDAPGLTIESEDCQESQIVPESERAGNLSNLEVMTSEVDMPVFKNTDQSDEPAINLEEEISRTPETSALDSQSDSPDKSAVGHELERVYEEHKVEKTDQVESSAQDTSLEDQVAEETASVDVMNKEASSADLTSDKIMAVEEATILLVPRSSNEVAVEEATNLLVPRSSNEVAVDEGDQNLDASQLADSGAVNEVHVPDSSHDSRNCLQSEDGDLAVAVGNETALPVSCDSDITGGVIVEDGSFASQDGISSSADDSCSQSKLENSNDALPKSANGTESENKSMTGEVDVASKTNYDVEETLKQKISFGSFECASPFSQNVTKVHPDVMNRSIDFSTSQPNFVKNFKTSVPTDGVFSLRSEVDDIPSINLDHKGTYGVVNSEQISTEKASASPLEGSGTDSSPVLDVNPDLVSRPFYYLIRIPRFTDVTLAEEISLSDKEVGKQTEIRDAVRAHYQKYKTSLWELKTNLEAAKSEERTVHRLLMAKKREIDCAQSLIHTAKNAITIDDVGSKIRNLEHKIQHETLDFAEEKRLVREIKQLNQQREQLAANTQRQLELQHALDRRVETEELLKVLRTEMDAIRDNYAKAEESFRTAKKKYDERSALVEDLKNQFTSANDVRQHAYLKLQSLKRQQYEKNKLFYNYKDAAKVAYDLAGAGKKDSLEQHCINQVERTMELWNNDDEFRKEYIRRNEWSTLRRFGTKDGRALGPGEDPPSLANVSDNRKYSAAKVVNSVGTVPTLEKDFPVVAKNAQGETSLKKVTVQKNKPAPAKKLVETSVKDSVAEPSGRIEVEEKVEEEHRLTKEEEEQIRKEEQKQREEEQKRREEEAARLKEKHRLEEIAKAKEALERKRKKTEKAQARAEVKAQKEAAEKLKEKEKRAKKKEKKKGIVSEITEIEPAQLPESSNETTREPEVTEKPVTVTKKSHKPALYTKQVKTTKTLSAPPAPLRNRGKRRIPQWAWWLVVAILSVILIFPLGSVDIVGLFKDFTSGPSY